MIKSRIIVTGATGTLGGAMALGLARAGARVGILGRRAKLAAGRADLGRNGSYLVFRQLEQDVAGFWRFAGENTKKDGVIDEPARLRLAACTVGRWPWRLGRSWPITA